MKKVFVFSIIFIVAISVAVGLVISVQGKVWCGNTLYTTPDHLPLDTTADCYALGNAYYYYFYSSGQELTITITDVKGDSVFSLYDGKDAKGLPVSIYSEETGKYEECTDLKSVTAVLEPGYWTIAVKCQGAGDNHFYLKISTSGGDGGGPVCGNGKCDSGETCSNCSADCGACDTTKKELGAACSEDSQCESDNCSNGICCGAGVICCKSDGNCPSGSFCKSNYVCYYKKDNDASCSRGGECKGGYCVQGKCSSSSAFCGNGKCESGETCSNCSKDCGSCGPVCGNGKCESGESCSNCSKDCGVCKKADGEYCDKSEECKSGNCQNYRCCVKGKTCCFSHYHCGLDEYCDQDRHYCLPDKPDGQKCTEDAQCLSNICGDEVKICCYGQVCCVNHSDCRENEYCQQETYYCRYKWLIGDDCGDYGSAMCKSGYCDSDTWTCAEKPEFIEEPVEEKSAEPPTQIALSLPQSVFLKKGQVFIPLITIENKSMEEVTLGNEIQIENSIPASLEINKTPILVFKKRLSAGEKASVAAQNRYDMIEKLTLTGKAQGSGEVIVKVVYFYKNEARWLEKKILVQVSREHVQKEETATALFKEEMILDKKDAEHIFVEPADSSDYQVTRNAWQEAQQEIYKHLNNLKGDFQAMIEPEIITFFRTMEDLSEAKTSREITETAIRAAAPPIIMAAVDFANLLDAIEMQKEQERILLEHFGGTEFTNVPTYDEKGEIVGYAKAIIREEDGNAYAIKIGDF